MEVIAILLPIGILIAGGFLIAYFWAVRAGQFDDTVTPAHRILIEDEPEKGSPSTTNPHSGKEV